MNKTLLNLQPGIERLEMLANHLLSGVQDHEIFDFTAYNRGLPKANGCGTAGCAIGECPKIWPDIWAFRSTRAFKDLQPLIVGCFTPDESAIEFFNIPHEDYYSLFHPNSNPLKDGLPDTATREEVANHILDYCKRNK